MESELDNAPKQTLEQQRLALVCGHCSAIFEGSRGQVGALRYKKVSPYCSSICRTAAMRNRFSTPIPNRGPCKTCGKEFFSRGLKKFCSLACYTTSDQFKLQSERNREKNASQETRDKIAAALRTGEKVACLECQAEIYQKKSRPRKYCSNSCYRSYMAKRFDRWVANPEGLSLPQCYDEFLSKPTLTCMIDGCGWSGHFLALHMNTAHGVPKNEFKRAAGFNLGTGVISKHMSDILCARAPNIDQLPLLKQGELLGGPKLTYRSTEGKEHRAKARSIATETAGPERLCDGCGVKFTQSTICGRAKYCTPTCRDDHYAKKKKEARRDR